LTGTGFEGKKVRVELREQDKSDVLAELEVTVGPDGQPQQVRLPYRPTQVGQFRYVVEVEPQEDELQTENNRERTVACARRRSGALVVVPSFEFRTWQHAGRAHDRPGSSPERHWSTRTGLGRARGFPVSREELNGW
jgi:hypothetical protein